MKERPSACLFSVLTLWLVLIWGWTPSVLTLPVDDAFYYLQIARNIARGVGVTFDGVDTTSGFHPLWLMVLVPVARAFGRDPDTYVRAVLSLNVALTCAGALVLSRVSRSALWGVVLMLLPFHLAKVLLNGQESSLVWLLMAICIARLARNDRPNIFVNGALAGAVILSRLSAVPFAVAFLLSTFGPTQEESTNGHTFNARITAKQALQALCVMACICSPWWVWLLAKTGHLTTVSAAIKIGSPARVALASVFALISVILALFLARRIPRFGRLAWLAPLVAQVMAELGVMVLRGSVVPDIWTLVPHLMLAVLLIDSLPHGRVPLVLATSLCAVMSWRMRLDPRSWSIYASARHSGEWVAANTPEQTIIAGWDCGIAALFANRIFYPLDGLVGSWTYKENYLDPGHIEDFLRARRVEIVVQYVPTEILENDPSVSFKGAQLAEMTVEWSECGEFRSAMGTNNPWAFAYVALRRGSSGPNLGQTRKTLCAQSWSPSVMRDDEGR